MMQANPRRGAWICGIPVLLTMLSGCMTPKPKVVPVAGLYGCPLTVTITDRRPNAQIFYTIDGSNPTQTSTKYSGPFLVGQANTVKAIAIVPGAKVSDPADVAYACALTRAKFATLLQKQYKLSAPTRPLNFPDVSPNDPSYAAIQAAASYLNSQVLCSTCYLRPQFFPDEPIYRLDSSLALTRVLLANGKVQLLSDADSATVLSRVPDAASLPAFSKPYFATAIRAGVLQLGAGNKIQRDRLQTQDEMAVIFGLIQKQYNLPAGNITAASQ
jgi:hypothetical protein